MSWLVSPLSPQDYWWLDALGLVACAALWLWIRRADREGPVR